jgi:hypothetical protein
VVIDVLSVQESLVLILVKMRLKLQKRLLRISMSLSHKQATKSHHPDTYSPEVVEQLEVVVVGYEGLRASTNLILPEHNLVAVAVEVVHVSEADCLLP